MNTFDAFTKGELSSVIEAHLQEAINRIHSEREDYILNVNEDDYIGHLISEFTLSIPVVDFDNVTVSSYEKMVSGSRHPNSFWVEPHEEYKRQVVVYHLPFSGELELLNYMPNPRIVWSEKFGHDRDNNGENLTFELVNFSQNPEDIKREADRVIQNLRTQLGHIARQVEGFNSSLSDKLKEALTSRKNDLKNKGGFLDSLGVPVRKKDNLPQTFSVPAPKIPMKIIPKPPVTIKSGKPEPTLDNETYQEILQVIHDLGKAIERMPSTYKNKSEEELRDHILMYLEPRFEGSATGETFNKTGKTDILLRYQNSNVFVAECKYWSGESDLLKAIDQLLGYLTWRDSKTALVIFVKNKDLSSVINNVKSSTSKHPNYLGFDGEKEETWLSYKIHLNNDKDREIYLTILLFHFPEI